MGDKGMNNGKTGIYMADAALHLNQAEVNGGFTVRNDVKYYIIRNYHRMPPFFMSLVSSSDHWMFVSSSGGLTAGRVDADHALFPYYTVDKVTENSENTGHKTIFLVEKDEKRFLWEPFSTHEVYSLERNLFKSICGDEIVFQEINHDLNLEFTYSWRTSEKFGFLLRAELRSRGELVVPVSVLSGLINILPWGVSADMQRRLSNLLDAYKLSELDRPSGMGLFGFSAKVTDLAEPSESLKVSTVWQSGLEDPRYLLSARQVNDFRVTGSILPEYRVEGERGAFFVNSSFLLAPGKEKTWTITADVNQDHCAVIKLKNSLERSREDLFFSLREDSNRGTEKLKRIIAGADGLQKTNDALSTVHHFANVLYNTMRGGTFYNNYTISRSYLISYLTASRKDALKRYSGFFQAMPEWLSLSGLLDLAERQNDKDLHRLCRQYLPLYFSRRHGDPSRPWNKFAIQLKEPDGTDKLDYQGNWRDIFQNWEALALSYPEYIESMIFRFLNATTADGYNPYRIHLSGVDWEKPDPGDPWSNIGYWSDHQIIYLLKLLELSLKFHPDYLNRLVEEELFVHTNIPYRIKPYKAILNDPYQTIEFDEEEDQKIETCVSEIGADGQLLTSPDGEIFYVNMLEKLVILLLAKLSNFIPGGGLWMNTQRPEWNDANNALAGKGLSVVSICYMRRYLSFLLSMVEKTHFMQSRISTGVLSWQRKIGRVLEEHRGSLHSNFDERGLKSFMDGAGRAADEYRQNLYLGRGNGSFSTIEKKDLVSFFSLALEYVDHCITRNKREDGLYHSYNILSYDDSRARIRPLYEMLEGQVAVLSSGLLSADESLRVLTALRKSRMYRKDQNSYMLYPQRPFPGFLERNTFTVQDATGISLITALVEAGDTSVVSQDENGCYHFNGAFHNVKDLRRALGILRKEDCFAKLVEAESDRMEELFLTTFNHQEFTGRSGSFFGYEGLGSIYWHMVSKLLLAAQESVRASVVNEGEETLTAELVEAYYTIRNGIGFKKSPRVYGAFPTDPYSHTPANRGAKQPGMTGQVKEEIVTRLAELGLDVDNGEIRFIPYLLRKDELLETRDQFVYYNVRGDSMTIDVPSQALAFTFCQLPFILVFTGTDRITLETRDGSDISIDGTLIPREICRRIFTRDESLVKVTVESSASLI